MNVLLVTVLSDKSPSGVVTYYNRLADDLRKQGLTVRIIDASDTPLLWQKLLAILRRVLPVFGNSGRAFFNDFAWFTGMYLAVLTKKMARPDLIHAQDASSGTAAYLALGRKVPVVLTCHFNDDPAQELITRFSLGPAPARRLGRWYAFLFSHIKNYVFTSNYVYTKAEPLLPTDAHKLILYNTITTDAIAVTASRMPSETITIINVGYIDERKNQKLLIEIGAELRKRGLTNFVIWLIGDGPKRAEYEQLAAQLGLAGQVKFYGQQRDPWRLVAKANLYIHTALNDNCPYSILEAFAVKTPVLALPVGGIPEMLPRCFGPLHGTEARGLAGEVAGYFDADRRMKLLEAQSAHAERNFNHRTALTTLISFYHQTSLAA